MAIKTPNVQYIVDELIEEFGPKIRVGAWLCRPIAGTFTWSQHAYHQENHLDPDFLGNAADIFPDTMAIGDQVAAFIRGNYPEVVKVVLWRVKHHFDHVHFDTWPTGINKPPCKGGKLQVRHKDGKIGRAFTLDLGDDDLPLNDEDKAWIRTAVNSIVDAQLDAKLGKTIAIPGEPKRLTTQAIVNGFHSLTRSAEPGSKIYERIESTYDNVKKLLSRP